MDEEPYNLRRPGTVLVRQVAAGTMIADPDGGLPMEVTDGTAIYHRRDEILYVTAEGYAAFLRRSRPEVRDGDGRLKPVGTPPGHRT